MMPPDSIHVKLHLSHQFFRKNRRRRRSWLYVSVKSMKWQRRVTSTFESTQIEQKPNLFFSTTPIIPIIYIFLNCLLYFLVYLVPQKAPPVIQFAKKQFYVGEKLIANCTTSRAKPVPHVVWLINGKKVNTRGN